MTQNAQERIHLHIAGRVQGVGFRWFVMSEARRLDLRGWVRNNPDGSVELEAGGPRAKLDELRERVAVGPRAARVDHITELPISAAELFNPFDVST
jgi:acylphosphatase